MKKRHVQLSREPQEVTDRTWYYEYKTHIGVYHSHPQPSEGNNVIISFKIPWSMLEKSLARLRSVRRARKRRIPAGEPTGRASHPSAPDLEPKRKPRGRRR